VHAAVLVTPYAVHALHALHAVFEVARWTLFSVLATLTFDCRKAIFCVAVSFSEAIPPAWCDWPH